MMVEKIGNYNVSKYPGAMFDKNGQSWFLVVVDKFTPTQTWVGTKSYYFSSDAYLNASLTRESLESLWELPTNTKVKGTKVLWQIC